MSSALLPEGWEMVVGLEVHAQILSESKLFSGSSTRFGAEPNTQVSLIDAAMPGMLPSLNRACIEQGIRTALALQGNIVSPCQFERKHYFYPDLPQGYQISQYAAPLMRGGGLALEDEEGKSHIISIERMHLEQDAGKSLHDMLDRKTCVDLNRSGVGLMEIVSEPVIGSPEEASAYVAKLRTLLKAIGVCDGNMQEGSLRVDANVSVRKRGAPLGTRTEIKNLNSLKFLRQALAFEAKRQYQLLQQGKPVVQETRLFDTPSGRTQTMRSKEEAHDYRYFPDPDIPPLVLDSETIERLRGTLPEMPDARGKRFQTTYGLSQYEAELLAREEDTARYYETLCRAGSPQSAAKWMLTELFARLKSHDSSLAEFPVQAERAAALLRLIATGRVSARAAKDLFDSMLEDPSPPAELLERIGLQQIDDEQQLNPLIEALVADNPKQRQEYQRGKTTLFGWFVGQAMQKTQGRASPKRVNAILRKVLDKPS